jgi:methylated-DNA-[protein]-cysteine S-methyltransferase
MSRRHATLSTALGELLVVADGNAMAGVYYPEHWHPPVAGSTGVPVEASADSLFASFASQLAEFLDGRRRDFTLPTALVGDPFQLGVWDRLRAIPYGETTTYGALATELGDRNLARRVGGAVGRNPLSIIVPCHRVVGAGGALIGYAGGLERKLLLLELEGAPVVAQRRLF